ncbi:binding beak 2 [Octopus vulgaris]|uniref:Binding beak 2 n=1 Tax=Octopus vulgaris TaxID=6645 RepID=A0AA36AZL8_OCTVU|nr:binding beak 2 [Octopus vulgaris]
MEFRFVAAILLIAVSTVYSQSIMTLCQQTQVRAGSHFVRSPSNCSEFYLCNAMFPIPLACGNQTVFSQSQQVCVWRNSQYDDCDKPVYGGRFDDPLCNQYPDGMNRDPADCHSEFYLCNAMFPIPMACGFRTVFSQSQQVCVWRNSQYDDCDRPVYGGRFDDPLCNQYPDGMNRDPSDCHRIALQDQQ